MENYLYNFFVYESSLVINPSVTILASYITQPSIQVHVGKERDAILDMLPYLRLGYVSDPSEMQSVLSSQGPICPVCLCCYSSFTVYETEHIILDGCGASNC